jgi:peptidoglycan/LPS O-acetylase OafA/YrhL
MMKNRRLITILITVIVLLSIPFLAMQFTDEVSWSVFDFLVMGTLLLGTGLAFEFVLRKVKKREYRIVLLIAILVAMLLIWAELSVGIFGSPFAGS